MEARVRVRRYEVSGAGLVSLPGANEEREFRHMVYARSGIEAKRIASGMEVIQVSEDYGDAASYRLVSIDSKEA